MTENFQYKDLITENDWELLIGTFVNYIGVDYVRGRSGFVKHSSYELIDPLKQNLSALAERVRVNVPEAVNVPIDVFEVDGGLSVAFDEKVLTECARDFCIANGIDFKQAVNYHKKARSEEQARVYALLKHGLMEKKLEYNKMLLALGRVESKEASFINKLDDGSFQRVAYDSTYLDYWSLSAVIERLDGKIVRKLVGQNQLVFDILGIMPQGSGVMLNFYIA